MSHPFNPRANGAGATRNGFVRGRNTGTPCAGGTCSYAVPNAQFEAGKTCPNPEFRRAIKWRRYKLMRLLFDFPELAASLILFVASGRPSQRISSCRAPVSSLRMMQEMLSYGLALRWRSGSGVLKSPGLRTGAPFPPTVHDRTEFKSLTVIEAQGFRKETH